MLSHPLGPVLQDRSGYDVMRMTRRKRIQVRQLAVLGVALGIFLTTLLILRSVRFIRVPVSSSGYCPSDLLNTQEDHDRLALYFKSRPNTVNEPVSRFFMQPYPQTCSSKLDLLMLVPSPPGAAVNRNAVRKTWGSVVTKQWPHVKNRREVALIFLLGKQENEMLGSTMLKEEADAHGDLLIGDFVDSYRNLTLKVLTGLNWVSTRCSGKVEYVLKADQDTFVNVDLLLNTLSELELDGPLVNTMLGELLCSEPANRDYDSRVYVDPSVYPFAVYPPYVRGGSYVLSGDLVSRLVNVSRYMPYLPVEDAYINGVLARTLDVRHVHVPRVMSSMVCHAASCVFLATKQVTATNTEPDLMQSIWQDLQKGPQYCQNHPPWWSRACILFNSYWS